MLYLTLDPSILKYVITTLFSPAIEQGNIFPHTLSHVGTGSKQETLPLPSDSSWEMGVAPQGQVVIAEGRRGHDGHAPS